MLTYFEDNRVAMWLVFSDVWNAVRLRACVRHWRVLPSAACTSLNPLPIAEAWRLTRQRIPRPDGSTCVLYLVRRQRSCRRWTCRCTSNLPLLPCRLVMACNCSLAPAPQVVEELRSVDLVSDSERDNLLFVHLDIDPSLEILDGMR